MSSRLDAVFDRLRHERRTGLVTYVTAGDPDLERSAGVLDALDRGGADVIEVGVPFSDPMADGPVIQRASERALAAGTTLAATLSLVARRRAGLRAPLVLFTYANPVLRLGTLEFVRQAADAGIDGVLVLDLPVEEAGELRDALVARDIAPIFLLSPTTTPERIRRAASLGSGFLYAISRLGVTGPRDTVAAGARELAHRIRAETRLPIALGFGLSTPAHVAEVGRWVEAAVVGSALVQRIADRAASPDLYDIVEEYVRWLRNPVDPDATGTAVPAPEGGRSSTP